MRKLILLASTILLVGCTRPVMPPPPVNPEPATPVMKVVATVDRCTVYSYSDDYSSRVYVTLCPAVRTDDKPNIAMSVVP